MTDEKLKACPFCGEPARLIKSNYGRLIYFIDCTKCGAEMLTNHVDATPAAKKAVIRAWNTRAEGKGDG